MRRLLPLLLAVILAACRPTTEAPALPTLAPTLPPPPAPIEMNGTVEGTLTLDDRFTDFGFEGDAGQRLELTTNGGNFNLLLTDEDGVEVAQGNPLEVSLAEAGDYTVRVQLTAGEQADFELTLTELEPPPTDPSAFAALPTFTPEAPTPTPEPFAELGTILSEISVGQPIFGAFNAADERHVYTFDSGAGAFARIQMQRTSGNVDPVLTLYDPDGVAIAVDDNGGGGRTALLNGVALPLDGTYALVADGDGLTGTYEITLATSAQAFAVTPVTESGALPGARPTQQPIVLTPTLAPGISGNRLEDHQPVLGSLDRVGGVNRYVIQADAGEVFTVGLAPQTVGFVPQIEMSSPSGSIAAIGEQAGADGETLIYSYEASTTGGYVVFVTGQDDTLGDYILSFGRGPTRESVRKGEIFADRTYESLMERSAVRDDWFLRLNAGDTITATASSQDGRFDPIMALIAPDGTRLIEDDNFGGGLDAQIQTVRVSTSGIYTLRVTSADPRVFGLYTLTWRFIDSAPTPTPPLLMSDLFSIDDTVFPESPQLYPVQGNAGERLLIEVEAVPGSGLDTIVELVNAEGEVFASDDDSGGDLNPSLLAQIPADGLYQVRVRVYDDGNNSGGAFVLRVRRVY